MPGTSAGVDRLRAEPRRPMHFDIDPVVETRRTLPFERGRHEHHVELVDPDRTVWGTPSRPSMERIHASSQYVQPVRVEHDALAVDLRVKRTADPVDERSFDIISPLFSAVRRRRPRATASIATSTAQLRDLVVGQRVVGRPEAQCERETAPARPQHAGAEHVEQADRGSSRSAPAARNVTARRHRPRQVLVDDEREVDARRRVGRRHVAEGTVAPARAQQRVEVDLGGDDGCDELQGVEDKRSEI